MGALRAGRSPDRSGVATSLLITAASAYPSGTEAVLLAAPFAAVLAMLAVLLGGSGYRVPAAPPELATGAS